MLRGAPDGMERTIADLLRSAADAARTERHGEFSDVVCSVLERVGSRVRMVVNEPEGTEHVGTEVDCDVVRNPEGTVFLHFKHPNAKSWAEMSEALTDMGSVWDTVPFEPRKVWNLPIAFAAVRTRSLVEEALGPALGDAGQGIDDALEGHRERMLALYPDMQGHGDDLEPDDFHIGMLRVAFPRTMLRRRRIGKKGAANAAYYARSLARLAASSPAQRWHAATFLKNAARAHELAAVHNSVTHGLATLREIEEPTEREHFEKLLLDTRETAYKHRLFHALREEGDDSPDDVLNAVVSSTWIGRTMPLPDDDPGKAPRDALLREELAEAAAFVRHEAETGWERVYGEGKRRACEGFLRAWDFLKDPPGETPRKLREAIDADRCRDELEAAERMHHAEMHAAKQAEIVARVFHAVLRYQHSSPGAAGSHDPACCSPAYAAREKKVNCFTGPWLAAAMLLECGFREEELYYCDAQGVSESVAGTHGSLLVALASGQQLLLDVGFKKMRTVPFRLYDAVTRRNVETMLELEEEEEVGPWLAPVRAELPGDAAERTGIHPLMHVMPMRAGFAWGTLLSAGLDFFEAGKVPEARHAFELAHALHPASPDVLVGLARCCLAEGDGDAAKLLLDDALRRCPRHRMAMYRRAILHAEDGEYGHARILLDFVLDERVQWYGAKEHVEHAKQLSAKLNDILRHQTSLQLLDMKSNMLPCIEQAVQSVRSLSHS